MNTLTNPKLSNAIIDAFLQRLQKFSESAQIYRKIFITYLVSKEELPSIIEDVAYKAKLCFEYLMNEGAILVVGNSNIIIKQALDRLASDLENLRSNIDSLSMSTLTPSPTPPIVTSFNEGITTLLKIAYNIAVSAQNRPS